MTRPGLDPHPLATAAQLTVFQWLRHAATRPAHSRVWMALGLLVLLGWVGSTAFLGQYRPTEVSRVLVRLAPYRTIFVLCGALALLIGLLAWRMAWPRLGTAATVVAAFLAGHQLYAVIYPLLPARFVFPFRAPQDWMGFAVARLAYGVSILAVCLPVWWLVYRRQQLFPALALGHGDWSVRGRDTFAKEAPASWGRRLVTGYLIFAAIFFVLMQANVGFEPVRSGAILAFLPAICGAALANASAEELVFRGVLQPAFVRYGGIAAGVWMQGLLFGLLHWGNSVGVLAALPVSMLIGLGSVIWGKAALETGGLTWVIIAHALLDVGVMSAFFVPRVGP